LKYIIFFIFIVSQERQQKKKRNKFGEGGKNKTVSEYNEGGRRGLEMVWFQKQF